MNDLLKYTYPSWNEVLTEQERNIQLSCSGNSRKDKIYKGCERKIKYGYPKECPAIKYITNLIIFL